MTSPPNEALMRLLRVLASRDYRFVTPTPATHARVVTRPALAEGRSVRDILGWSRPFRREVLDPELLECLDLAAVLEPAGSGLVRSTVRVSSLDDLLFLHSAYPTEDADSVFFGPDSYRFAHLIKAELERVPLAGEARIVDIGAGAGVGAIVAGLSSDAPKVIMVDVNPGALHFAAINADTAGIRADFILDSSLAGVTGEIDLAIANPPYLMDGQGRTYRDGGGALGTDIALTMSEGAVARLSSEGRLILYTGSAIVEGYDPLRDALAALADRAGRQLRYRELDPDVFGEELDAPAYRTVERIALIAAVIGP